MEAPPSSRVGNIGVFCHLQIGERVFLVRRAYRDRLWSLPGGAVERGEALIPGLVREVAEETGYHPANPLHVCTYYSQPLYSIAVCFWEDVPHAFSPQPPNEEIAAGAWFPLSDLPRELSDRQRRWIQELHHYHPARVSLGIRESDV